MQHVLSGDTGGSNSDVTHVDALVILFTRGVEHSQYYDLSKNW
jgi:hypothetical protein